MDEKAWKAKQKAAKPSRYYGDGGTIHTSTDLDVEVDPKGQVVAVWFRCQPLPFNQSEVDFERSDEMRRMYERPSVALTGVEVLDPK